MIIPPIKSQGIKTKLVPWINELTMSSGIDANARWIEPFFGTGVVGFNSPLCGTHIVGDTNPHIINFYKAIQTCKVTERTMRSYLERERESLETSPDMGYEHFLEVRKRFNNSHDVHDFIFLSRAGFNGLMRFNRHGEWNVPFCKKQKRFTPSYITKICNQVVDVAKVIKRKEWMFNNSSFLDTILKASKNDIIYCDPPYFGRYTDYYNGWTENDERTLYDALAATKAKFILSTWHHNDFRENTMFRRYWSNFNVSTKEHFYHNGGKIENRHAVVEALVYNFEPIKKSKILSVEQPELFAATA